MFAASSPSSLGASPRSPFLIAADLFDPPVSPLIDDPVAFAQQTLAFTPWSKQIEVMHSVRDQDRTAVRACHGVGKTAVAAQIALWFLGTRPNSRVITTAPTWAQVERLLWVQIRSAVARAHQAGKGHVFPKPNKTALEIADDWFALGLSTNQPERFQGHHADHLLLIVDEASGVDESIFEAAEGFLTAEGAKVLLIGNPTRIGGQFHRCFTSERARWNQIHISVLDSPNYTGEPVPPHVARSLPRASWAEEARAAWGEDSPMYQVRALGNFPSHAENAVIPLILVEQAQQRDLPADPATETDIVIGCDVARYGSDETVITRRVGRQVRILDRYHGQPTTVTAGKIAQYAGETQDHVTRIVIDDTGVGGGVTDQLRDVGRWTVTAFNGAEKPYRPEYPNRRSELWFEAAAQMPGLDLDTDEQLAADLTSPRYQLNLRNQRQVEPKDETKRRLGRSPDRADAVLLTLVPSDRVVMPPTTHRAYRGQGLYEDWDAPAPSGPTLTGDLLDDPI